MLCFIVCACNDMINYDGTTAISYAAMNGHIDIVRLLVKANADLNLQDKVYTLLPFAVLCSRTVEFVSCLVGTMLNVSPTCEPQFIRCCVIM